MSDAERADYWEAQAHLFKSERDEQAKTIESLNAEAHRKWREARYWKYFVSKNVGARVFSRLESRWLKLISVNDDFMS